jgi:Protein of unknown function (DUF2934)
MSSKSSKKSSSSDETQSLATRIAERAHEKFVARGSEHGHDVEDWHASAAELENEVLVLEEQPADDQPRVPSTQQDGVQLR